MRLEVRLLVLRDHRRLLVLGELLGAVVLVLDVVGELLLEVRDHLVDGGDDLTLKASSPRSCVLLVFRTLWGSFSALAAVQFSPIFTNVLLERFPEILPIFHGSSSEILGVRKYKKKDDLGEGVEAGARGERKELRAAGLLRRGLEHRHGLPARPLALVQDGVHLQADEQGC